MIKTDIAKKIENRREKERGKRGEKKTVRKKGGRRERQSQTLLKR